jgi:hypothetical protein
VLEDLTLTSEKVSDLRFWNYVSWLDTPLVNMGTERLGLSDLLVALAGFAGDDHMLRLAAIADKAQYEKVSGLRESRMIGRCREMLEKEGWMVSPRYKLSESKFLCFRKVALSLPNITGNPVRDAPVVVRLAPLWLETDGFGVVTDGVLVLFQVGISNPPIAESVRFVRFESDGFREIDHSILILLQLIIDPTSIYKGVGVIGLEPDSLRVVSDGVVVFLKLAISSPRL